jgi:hypothetical protein
VKAPEIAAFACDPVVIVPARGWVGLELAELWRYRELIGFLALRDIRIRYKQSLLGVAWAVIQPLLTMVVFTVLFGTLRGRRGMPTDEGVPYAVSTYCALVPGSCSLPRVLGRVWSTTNTCFIRSTFRMMLPSLPSSPRSSTSASPSSSCSE